ncbi:hypothetical protein DY000_02061124 [Brassica cretica]|uniref:Replication protein A 70 kDa DNA-binding subunit B/D first OB fold domain-containing protein n=1 Tax=Brassica cretica TaxID=69181 RepID=A0ABQ7B2Q3_BRACR|nr:hypothetical protein DY000_02061124 [Brassica cretica]
MATGEDQMQGFNSVADLKPFKTMRRVKVSIVRLWKQYSAAGGLTIEMVLIDSNGDKIHASVKKELVNQFEHQLEQGKTLTFTNFSLNHSVGSYRTTNHLYEISVLSTTRVRSCEALPVGLNGFTPVNFQEVLDGSLNPDFLIVSHVELISVNGKETQKISLELRDLADVRLPMVLWENFATDVTNAIQLRGEGRVVLVLRFGKIKVWKGFNSVADLKPFKTMRRAKVSIVRLWKQYSAAGGLTIEMVLIDSNGDKIHASVKKELVNQFEHQLEQGKTLNFTNFSLNHSVGSYRTTNHLYKISVLSTTRVRSCEALSVGLNGFTLVNFQEVLDGSLNPDFLIDVIRPVVEVSHVEMISVNGKETQKISLELRDLADVRLLMVLWGNFATDVTNAIQLRGEGRVVLVLRFDKIKVWKEDRSVSNAYNVSDVQLNPNMAEVEAFRAMLPADEL